LFFFFFQAEDGIRELTVTGVQTCALPIFSVGPIPASHAAVYLGTGCPPIFAAKSASTCRVTASALLRSHFPRRMAFRLSSEDARSEERRVGKEWRSRWEP